MAFFTIFGRLFDEHYMEEIERYRYNKLHIDYKLSFMPSRPDSDSLFLLYIEVEDQLARRGGDQIKYSYLIR